MWSYGERAPELVRQTVMGFEVKNLWQGQALPGLEKGGA